MRRILLLNSAYEPISFIGERKALSLVLRKVADIVTSWSGDIMLTRWEVTGQPLELPSTMRLHTWHNRKTKMPRFKRHVVFARDNYQCQYCARDLSEREATIDHVIPKSQGGQLVWKNAVTACRPCNRYKDNNTPEKAGMVLMKAPITPTVAHFWDMRHTDSNWCPDWDVFIPR